MLWYFTVKIQYYETEAKKAGRNLTTQASITRALHRGDIIY